MTERKKQNTTEKDRIEKITQVVATLAIENMFFSEEDKKNIIKLANGEISEEELLEKINKKYQVANNDEKEMCR